VLGHVFNLGSFVRPKDRSIVGPNECVRKQKELVTKGSEVEALQIIGQASTLKRRDEVIGKADDLSVMLLEVTILTAPSRCGAQTNLATLRGTVTNPSDATVPNAAVELTKVVMNVSRNEVTNAVGDHEIPYLVPGTYQLTCGTTKFEKFVAQEIALVGYQTRRLDIQMHVGAASTQVTVRAGAAVISTENAQITGGFTEDAYKDPPESGASYALEAQMVMVLMVQPQQGSHSLTISGLSNTQVSESSIGKAAV